MEETGSGNDNSGQKVLPQTYKDFKKSSATNLSNYSLRCSYEVSQEVTEPPFQNILLSTPRLYPKPP